MSINVERARLVVPAHQKLNNHSQVLPVTTHQIPIKSCFCDVLNNNNKKAG